MPTIFPSTPSSSYLIPQKSCVTLASSNSLPQSSIATVNFLNCQLADAWDGIPPIAHDACGNRSSQTATALPTSSPLHCTRLGPWLLSHHQRHQRMHITQSESIWHRFSQSPHFTCMRGSLVFLGGFLYATGRYCSQWRSLLTYR